MFHIDSTFEDIRIIATSQDNCGYEALISDSLSGDSASLHLTAKQLSMIMAFNLHPDGEPLGFESFYAELEPLIAHLPRALRPIP